jgi:hypothetical protein
LYFTFVKRRPWFWLFYLPLLPFSAPLMDPVWPDRCVTEEATKAMNAPAFVGASALGTRSSATAACASSTDPMEEMLRSQTVCIAWNKPWAGKLGDALLFHASRTGPKEVVVGYFAYWSTERPWGDNDLTRQILPALAIDAVYSHLFFVFPGVQRVMYGPGDIEGIRVTYRLEEQGRLVPAAVHADDERHREVRLELPEAVDDFGRVVVLTDVWSHQLGGRRAVQAVKAGAQQRCFSGSALRGLTKSTSDEFRLGRADAPRRARPAWRVQPVATPQLLAQRAE